MNIETKSKEFLTKNPTSLLNCLKGRKIEWVIAKISEGVTLSEIANHIIKTWVPDAKKKQRELVTDLAKFKFEVFQPVGIAKIQAEKKNDIEAEQIVKSLEHLQSKINGMGRLGWLIDRQTERLQFLLSREKNALPMNITNDVVRQLGTLLEKYIGFQITVGEQTSVPQEHLIKVDARVNALLEHTIHETGDEMALAAAKLIESAKQKAITLDLDKSGRYCRDSLPAIETEQLALLPSEVHEHEQS